MLKIARLKAYEEQKEKAKVALLEAKEKGETKAPRIPVELQVYTIGAAL